MDSHGKETAVDIHDEAYRKALIDEAGARARRYKLQGYHCSEATIRACSETLGLRLSEDVLRCASGFRGGGGGYHDRCGVIEAGCMLVSYLYGRLAPQQEAWPYSYLIRQLHLRFQAEFATIYCRDILEPQLERGETLLCIDTYERGARVVTGLLLDADRLLAQIPEEEKLI